MLVLLLAFVAFVAVVAVFVVVAVAVAVLLLLPATHIIFAFLWTSKNRQIGGVSYF